MAQINNSELVNELVKGGRLSSSEIKVPPLNTSQVIPVMEVNPKLLRRCDIVKNIELTNATGATIYTTPANQDFYLTSCSLSVGADVTATSRVFAIQFTVNGAVTQVCQIARVTLTAMHGQLSMTFPTPIKVDRNTAISAASSTNVANFWARASIAGYVDESSQA